MQNGKILVCAFVLFSAMTAIFQSEAVNLPDGYVEAECVTIPLGTANRNGVATAVAWLEVTKAYVKYATTDTVPGSFMILAGTKGGSDKTRQTPYIALSNSGGKDCGLTTASTGWKFGGVWCSGTGDPDAFDCAGDLKIDGGLTRFLAPDFTFDVGGEPRVAVKIRGAAQGLLRDPA